jgi:hypothetical protein
MKKKKNILSLGKTKHILIVVRRSVNTTLVYLITINFIIYKVTCFGYLPSSGLVCST